MGQTRHSTALGLVAANGQAVDLGVRYGVAASSSGMLQEAGLATLKVRL